MGITPHKYYLLFDAKRRGTAHLVIKCGTGCWTLSSAQQQALQNRLLFTFIVLIREIQETSRSTGKAPAALFFDDTSGLNSLSCDSVSLLESNYQSEKIVRIHIRLISYFSENSLAVKFPYLVQVKLKKANKLGDKLIKASFMSPCCIYGESPSLVMPSVMYGEDYVRLGFLFGEKSRVAYIFDVSRFPPCTEYIISKSGGRQLDLLILDTSFKTLETIEFSCTKRGLLGRMTHEFDHHKDNECLEEWSNRYRALETITNCLNKPYAE
ncbi:unnamed protein product [Brassica oleracea]